jgi:hypothetical protein
VPAFGGRFNWYPFRASTVVFGRVTFTSMFRHRFRGSGFFE